MISSIVVTGYGEPIATLASTAQARRDDLLVEAGEVKAINDRLDADCAYSTLKGVTEYLDTIEAQREAAKAPHLAFGRSIDALSKELTLKLKAEQDRISLALGSFERKERDKAEDIRRAQEAEVARIERESRAEATRAFAKAPTEEAAVRAADAVVERAASAIVEAREKISASSVPKVEGSTLRGKPEYELLDVKALYAAHPELCKIEPNKQAIVSILRANPNMKIPGLRTWIANKVSV